MADSSKLITVSCSRHHDTLIRRLWHFFQTQKGVNFNLGTSGGRSVLAHLLVVDAFMSADKFAPKVNDDDSGAPDADLKRRDAHLASLVEFMYTGTVSVRLDNLPELRELAKELEFEMLVDAVESAVKRSAGRRRTPRRTAATPGAEVVAESLVETSYGDESGDGAVPESIRGPPPVEKRVRSSRNRAGMMPETSCNIVGGVPESEDPSSSKRLRPSRVKVGVSSGGDPEPPARDKVDEFDVSEEEDDEEDNDDSGSESLTEQDQPDSEPETTGGGRRRRTAGRDAPNHSKPKQCKLCRFKSISKRAYLVHQAKHDLSITVVKCEGCHVKFAEGDKALQNHHCVERIQYKCTFGPECTYHTPSRAFYFVHLANKHNSSDAAASVFLCEVCRKPFLDARARRRHQDKQHAAGPITYRCEQPNCSYQTVKLVTFKSHMFATHELDMYGAPLRKTQECEKCEYTCVRPSDLRMHMTMKHSVVKPFKCSKCNYAAGRRQDILTHDKRVHLGIKKHMCDFCGFRAITKYGLDMHRRIHTKERPFVCEVCGKAYGTVATLRWHAECHEKKGRPHVCHLCGHTSSRVQYMNAHLKNVHKVNMVKPRAKAAAAAAPTCELDTASVSVPLPLPAP